MGGVYHRTASETGLARTRGFRDGGTHTNFGVFVLLTPLFFVLPYGFTTPPSGTGGPVTQMSPLLYPSSLYQNTLFDFGYSRGYTGYTANTLISVNATLYLTS